MVILVNAKTIMDAPLDLKALVRDGKFPPSRGVVFGDPHWSLDDVDEWVASLPAKYDPDPENTELMNLIREEGSKRRSARKK